jgi:hypothetical protein
MDSDEENRFEYALGFAIVRRWVIFHARSSSFCSMRRLRATTAFEKGLRPSCMKSIPRPRVWSSSCALAHVRREARSGLSD